MEKNLPRKLKFSLLLFAVVMLLDLSGYAQGKYVTGQVYRLG